MKMKKATGDGSAHVARRKSLFAKYLRVFDNVRLTIGTKQQYFEQYLNRPFMRFEISRTGYLHNNGVSSCVVLS